MKKNPEKSLWGGFHRRSVARRSAAGRTRPTRKIARQRRKNKNFEKNGTYIKDSSVLSMPIIFFGDQTTFGDRISQKPKTAIFIVCRPAVNMPAAFYSFWLLILSQVASYAGILNIKGQFKVPCKKLDQNRILVENFGLRVNLSPPPANNLGCQIPRTNKG